MHTTLLHKFHHHTSFVGWLQKGHIYMNFLCVCDTFELFDKKHTHTGNSYVPFVANQQKKCGDEICVIMLCASCVFEDMRTHFFIFTLTIFCLPNFVSHISFIDDPTLGPKKEFITKYAQKNLFFPYSNYISQ
jgi:hypothetical protein